MCAGGGVGAAPRSPSTSFPSVVPPLFFLPRPQRGALPSAQLRANGAVHEARVTSGSLSRGRERGVVGAALSRGEDPLPTWAPHSAFIPSARTPPSAQACAGAFSPEDAGNWLNPQALCEPGGSSQAIVLSLCTELHELPVSGFTVLLNVRGSLGSPQASVAGRSRASSARLRSPGVTAPPSSAQAAALAVCQCLAVECTHPSSPASEDGSPSEATTPVPAQHLRPVRAKKRKQSPAPAPPTVRQLMEMGFPRRNIEFALKSLTGASGNAAGLPGTGPPLVGARGRAGDAGVSEGHGQAGAVGALGVSCVCSLAGVEALVGWLLDHADAQVTDLSDADTGSEDCSDEEVMEEFDDMAYAMVSASMRSPHPAPACPQCRAPPGRPRGLSAVLLGVQGHSGFKADPCSNIWWGWVVVRKYCTKKTCFI